MAKITISFEHPQATFSRAIDLADGDLVRLLTAYKQLLRKPGQQRGPDDTPQAPEPPLTNRQALERLCDSIWGLMRRHVREFEAQAAAQAAAATVQAIEGTPTDT